MITGTAMTMGTRMSMTMAIMTPTATVTSIVTAMVADCCSGWRPLYTSAAMAISTGI